MQRPPIAAAVGLAAAVWIAATVVAAQGPVARRSARSGFVDYEGAVQPILAKKCLECHSQDKRKGGLSLATYADALEGGRNGPVIRPGNAGGSLMLHRLTGDVEPQMPKDEPPLGDHEIAVIKAWIDQGARETPSSRPAPQPWEAPLTLTRPNVPPPRWAGWEAPVDRFVASYLSGRRVTQRPSVSDALFARRVYLDIWGLLPTPAQMQAFVDDRTPGKRAALVSTLLADNRKYAEHWISFWNDLLRNEDGVTYFSESASRKSITDWLLASLESNLPYDQFVTKLLNPSAANDPEGFLVGVNWRGETSAAVTPWMQASQNSAQIFLGINLKCNACHDSFVSKWKLKDAYSLAAYFSPEAKLQMFRCDVAQNRYAEPGFLFPELNRTPASDSLAHRRAAAAETFTDPRMGRLPRTLVNRVWRRLFGHGIVANPDEMDGQPWSPQLLDWLASDFVEHGYDVKRLLRTILTSRAYQMPAVARKAEPPARGYVFAGPEVRRLTAEQFADAIGAITGEWNVYTPAAVSAVPARQAEAAALNVAPARQAEAAAANVASSRQADAATANAASAKQTDPDIRSPLPSMPTSSGYYAREWRVASSDLTRALGRPVRDQVISARSAHASTLQALELTNGENLVRWLSRGARRMLNELPPEPLSLYNRAVAGRNATSSAFDIDISKSSRLWLIVQDNGSNVPEVLEPVWARAELIGPSGATPLNTLQPTPETMAALRSAPGPITLAGSDGIGVRVRNPSVVVYDITGRGFTRFRGIIGVENRPNDIGATLNPQLRFFVFDTAPNMERLIPPLPGPPLAPPAPATTIAQTVDALFRHALGRAPIAPERRLAEEALKDPARGSRPSPEGLADLLWAIVMKPEFQFIY
jgi:hypothetical protein